jgi:hypothetical protein
MTSMKWKWIAPLAFSLALVPVLAFGGQAVVPNTFVNGEVADANAVNANFTALAASIDDNDSRVAALECEAVIRVPHVVGDDAASGQALLDALASIPTNPAIASYQVLLHPGVYDVGAERVVVPDGVCLCGAGRECSIIHATGSTGILPANGSKVEVCALTLRCRPTSGGGGISIPATADLTVRRARIDVVSTSSAKGISATSGTADLFDVDIVVESSDTVANVSSLSVGGVTSECDLVARCCRMSVTGGDTSTGVLIRGGTALLEKCSVTADDHGVRNIGSDASDTVELHGCRVSAAFALYGTSSGAKLQAACSQIVGVRLAGVTIVHCYDEDFVAIP